MMTIIQNTTQKKKPSDYPNVSFRLSGQQGSEIAARTSAGGSAPAIAKRDLERYYDLLPLSLPKFSLQEALFLCDMLNGCIIEPSGASHLWADASDAIDEGYAAKWGIDGPALVTRLKALTPFECMAVVDAVERAWNAPTYHIEDMEGRLRQVGLVRG